jgi:hypothetical protein
MAPLPAEPCLEEVTGVKLVNNIPKIQQAIHVQLAQGINNACQYWVNEAYDLCPLGTEPRDYEDAPHLRDTIRQIKVATPSNLEGAVDVGTPSVYWGPLVNFGTSKMAAQPFWTVAGLLTRQAFHWLFTSGYIGISRLRR